VSRHAMMLLRDPDHTLLSEVERRNGWWGDNITLNPSFVVNWARNRGRALSQIMEFVHGANGLILAFESVAADPERLLRELADRIGFVFEHKQIEYEKHMKNKNARGDINVSKNPERIGLSRAISRHDKTDVLKEMVATTAAAPWFEAYRALHLHVTIKGGIMAAKALPRELFQRLAP
jgi:hypothetical protein